MINISIKYNGEFPNLCSGELFVTINGKCWEFPTFCLASGGYVTFDKDWQEEVGNGPWEVHKWPEGFPDKYKYFVIKAINKEIRHGCCGGCV